MAGKAAFLESEVTVRMLPQLQVINAYRLLTRVPGACSAALTAHELEVGANPEGEDTLALLQNHLGICMASPDCFVGAQHAQRAIATLDGPYEEAHRQFQAEQQQHKGDLRPSLRDPNRVGELQASCREAYRCLPRCLPERQRSSCRSRSLPGDQGCALLQALRDKEEARRASSKTRIKQHARLKVTRVTEQVGAIEARLQHLLQVLLGLFDKYLHPEDLENVPEGDESIRCESNALPFLPLACLFDAPCLACRAVAPKNVKQLQRLHLAQEEAPTGNSAAEPGRPQSRVWVPLVLWSPTAVFRV